MSDAFQFQSRVGDDGVLNLRLNLGSGEASKDVVVTITSAGTTSTTMTRREWSEFVSQTYGSCAQLGLERADQGEHPNHDRIA